MCNQMIGGPRRVGGNRRGKVSKEQTDYEFLFSLISFMVYFKLSTEAIFFMCHIQLLELLIDYFCFIFVSEY